MRPSISEPGVKKQTTAKLKIIRAQTHFKSQLEKLKTENTEKKSVIEAIGYAFEHAIEQEDSVTAMTNLLQAFNGYMTQAQSFHKKRIQEKNLTWTVDFFARMLPGCQGSKSAMEKEIQKIIDSFGEPLEQKAASIAHSPGFNY
ncbi:MAG: hypothetical protein JSR33_06140 [Proteobacteria bacterium]|nr:hypothetical protein [Pseudomonadota bacterium]